MGLRLGPGPVFVYEWLTAARRWQPYALRSLFVGLILIGMMLVQSDRPGRARGPVVSLHDLAVIGEQTYRSFVMIELTLILLAAPAVTAGAVCLDKARGTLDHMLVTDLSNAEIILGKLAVRLIPVLGLIACALPVTALMGLLGGIDPLAMVGSFIVATGCAVLCCSLAMTLSVHGRKTHEVLIMTYMILFVWIMAPILAEGMSLGGRLFRAAGASPWWPLLEWSHPYALALAPYGRPGRIGLETYLEFLAGCLLLSAALVLLATARVRRVALRQAGRPATRAGWRIPRLRLPGPSLDANPVAWREWHRTQPSRMMRVAWGIYAAVGLLCVLLVMAQPSVLPAFRAQKAAVMNAVLVTIGLLLVSVGAATSLAEERVRGSLDILLSTPMSTRSILLGKWWGSFRSVFHVVFGPAATTIWLAANGGYWTTYIALLGLVLAYGAAIASLGLALATWVSRLGRAIALCVTIYVLSMIVWPFAVAIGVGTPAMRQVGMMLGDPPFGMYFGTLAVSAPGPHRRPVGLSSLDIALAIVTWMIVLCGLAASLFAATVATFDQSMGRIPDDATRPPSSRPRRASPTSAELLALVATSSGVPEQDEADGP